MSSLKQREELLTHLAAEFFNTTSNRTSLITILRTSLSQNGKTAVILFTVFPETKEAEVLEFMKRQRREFRTYVQKHSRMGQIPFLDFAIDAGEKNRQQVDILFQDM